jgi:hypothetical protein
MYASFAQMEQERERAQNQPPEARRDNHREDAGSDYRVYLDNIPDDYEGDIREDDFDADDAAIDDLTAALGRNVRADPFPTVQMPDASDEKEREMKFVPPPRSLQSDCKVGIEFTPRIFPTPMRESKAAEEEDWIARNRKHLKKHSMFSKNLKGN